MKITGIASKSVPIGPRGRRKGLGAVGQGLGSPRPGAWRHGQPGAGLQRRQGQVQGSAVAAHQALEGLQGFPFEGQQVLLVVESWKC